MSDFKFKKRVLFVGIPDMAYVCLDGLLSAGVNIVGVIGPKKSHSTYQMFKSFSVSRNMNFIEWENLKDEKFLDYIRSLNVDVAVVASFNYKIPKELLEIPRAGFINIHPSLLPKYRGGNPYSSVIINGETETGVTLHFMDEGFDTGDIITQKRVPLTPMETMGTLFNRLNLLGMQMLVGVLSEFEKGDLPRYKQPQGEFVVGQSLKDNDLFIDYNKSAVEIGRFIRGLNPFLIASTTFRGNMIKIFMANVVDKDSSKYENGSISKIEEDKFYIATGRGFICPTAIQFGSFFVGNAQDFIKILAPKVGEVFK
jgi:methionyl-tRNA formyltransferase